MILSRHDSVFLVGAPPRCVSAVYLGWRGCGCAALCSPVCSRVSAKLSPLSFVFFTLSFALCLFPFSSRGNLRAPKRFLRFPPTFSLPMAHVGVDESRA